MGEKNGSCNCSGGFLLDDGLVRRRLLSSSEKGGPFSQSSHRCVMPMRGAAGATRSDGPRLSVPNGFAKWLAANAGRGNRRKRHHYGIAHLGPAIESRVVFGQAVILWFVATYPARIGHAFCGDRSVPICQRTRYGYVCGSASERGFVDGRARVERRNHSNRSRLGASRSANSSCSGSTSCTSCTSRSNIWTCSTCLSTARCSRSIYILSFTLNTIPRFSWEKRDDVM